MKDVYDAGFYVWTPEASACEQTTGSDKVVSHMTGGLMVFRAAGADGGRSRQRLD